MNLVQGRLRVPHRRGWRADPEPVRRAAEQFKADALLVNPYDVEQMAETILKAFRMSQTERTARNEAHATHHP